MNLVKLVDQFHSEDRCRAYLEMLRWPEGVTCPNCGSKSISRIKTRNQFDCNTCRNRFSVKAGTVFHDSHLPLWKWFLATYLMVESRKGISANQLKRTLAVSYKTAWYLCHRIRSAMEAALAPLGAKRGIVELDETYIGGKKRQRSHRDQKPKTMILGAIERGGEIRLRVSGPAHSPDTETLQEWIAEAVDDRASAMYTDGHHGYRESGDHDTKHEWVDHGSEEWVRGEVHTQSIESAWSLLKRSIVGSYHQLSVKHLPAYMDEFAFRFNNRENPFLFRDTLLKLLEAETLPYKQLVGD
jgi:transposase-like protein